MYNTDLPTRAELPSSAQLLRSTFIAMTTAAALLVTVVLPAEYAIDPTGVGRALGLAEMGEIKKQLAEEVDKDRLGSSQSSAIDTSPVRSQASLLGRLFSELVIGPAAAQSAPARRSDEMKVVLKPGEGTEVKLTMVAGAKASYIWSVSGGVVNFDMHGEGNGQSASYEKGRGKPSGEGTIEAAFDGKHGWFWRNRGQADVEVTLRTEGSYSDIQRKL